MRENIQALVESRSFNHFILLTILIAAAAVGMETYPAIVLEHGEWLMMAHRLVLGIFVVEAILKMAAHGRHFYRYFQDPWNVFDFTIVTVSLLPLHATYAGAMRLARILRTLRLLTALPKLQLLVAALLKSIPSMGYVGLLLLVIFYVYAVMGVFLFRDNDPVHFMDLPTSMLTLFRVVTLEDWTDVMYIQMYGSDTYPYENFTDLSHHPQAMPVVGSLFFVSFVMLGTMIILNLFIGVILQSMEEAQRERDTAAEQKSAERSLIEEIHAIEEQMGQLTEALTAVRAKLLSRRSAP
jgi:voltage-gated sodium channel